MRLSEHARARSQKRGISENVIELALAYGQPFPAGDGCTLYRVTHKEARWLAGEAPLMWRRYRDRLQRAAALEGQEGTIVTVMHRYKRFWRKL